MTATLSRIGDALGRLLKGTDRLELRSTPEGPAGDLSVPRAADGVWEIELVQGRPCLRPDESSYYLYFVIPEAFRRAGRAGLWLDVDYFGDRHGQFRVQYASRTAAAPLDGLYKPAEQRWNGDAAGLRRFRRALFPLPDFDPDRTQNLGASFRIEFRSEVLVSGPRGDLRAPARPRRLLR